MNREIYRKKQSEFKNLKVEKDLGLTVQNVSIIQIDTQMQKEMYFTDNIKSAYLQKLII